VPYGAYASLDEYDDAEGLVHISEVSTRWVRNIRNHMRENQKTVLKVLRVDEQKKHINLSLRRVSEREKRERLLLWKRERRGRRLFDMAAEKLGIEDQDAIDAVKHQLEKRFGGIYASFERTAIKGKKALNTAKISSEWVDMLSEIAKTRIRIPEKKVLGVFEMSCHQPNGVEVLRTAFKKAKKVDPNINIYVTGAPKYRIEVSATNYKTAERLLDKAVQVALKSVNDAGGEGTFTRL
jgi:translation initiation factor 2 subunit 1